MEQNVKKIELPNTPEAKKALEAFRDSMAEKRQERQQKAAAYAGKIKTPALQD